VTELDALFETATTPAPGKPRRRRGRRFALGTASAVVLALLAYVGVVLTHPLPASAATVPADAITTIRTAPVAPAWPTQGSAAIGLVGQPGLLGRSGTDASVPIASMTKTITALVLLDRYRLKPGDEGPTVTFGPGDVAILNQVWAEGGSWAPVEAGEQLTLTQAITVMMLRSANNYARSLANFSYGSQQAFVDAANAWLAEHGFTHTRMTDPSGYDPGSVSNMTDLVGIGQLAIADPVLGTIVDTQSATLPVVGNITNTDPLVGKNGVEGVKTGYTEQAGHCLLFAAKVDINGMERTLVGVMLGQPTYDALWQGVPKLLESYEEAFHEVDLTDAGKTVYGTYRTRWGEKAKLVAATQPSVEIYSASSVTVKVHARKLAAAPAKTVAGKVTFSYGGKHVVARLRTDRAIDAPDAWWRLSHPLDVFSVTLGGLLGRLRLA
jgi:D-alanyl-D-alanine carboxypeptidase (penicillin-binding protein 5/6)